MGTLPKVGSAILAGKITCHHRSDLGLNPANLGKDFLPLSPVNPNNKIWDGKGLPPIV